MNNLPWCAAKSHENVHLFKFIIDYFVLRWRVYKRNQIRQDFATDFTYIS